MRVSVTVLQLRKTRFLTSATEDVIKAEMDGFRLETL